MKVLICGKAKDSLIRCPFNDPTWEVWSLNDAPMKSEVPRWDRNFELHDIDKHHRANPKYAEFYQWLQLDHGKPIYLRQLDPEIPSGVAYPKDEVVARFGRYFTSTISWMLALAIHEGATDIGVYGANMVLHETSEGSEYSYQKPSCEYFIGLARGMGINVVVPQESDLLKVRHLYGFEDKSDWEAKLDVRRRELKLRKEVCEAEVEEADQAVQRTLGAIGEIAVIKSQTNGEVAGLLAARHAENEQQLYAMSAEKNKALERQWVLTGSLKELEYWPQWD